MTKPFSRHFETVHALDISAEMIRYAKGNINRENVCFCLIEDSSTPRPDNLADAVFSTHVFRHFDKKEDTARYFKEISRVLKAEGTMMIHLPMFSWPAGTSRLAKYLHRVKKHLEQVKAALKREMIERGRSLKLMRLSSYQVDWDYSVLSPLGFTEVELLTFCPWSNDSVHSFVFTRKAS